jgi:hypothetical protein
MEIVVALAPVAHMVLVEVVQDVVALMLKLATSAKAEGITPIKVLLVPIMCFLTQIAPVVVTLVPPTTV